MCYIEEVSGPGSLSGGLRMEAFRSWTMLSVLLLRQIFILFLIMFAGIILVKTGLLKREDQNVLIVLLLDIAMPCVVINSFLKVDYTPEIRNGFLLMLAAGTLIQGFAILVTRALRRPFHLTDVEEGSIEYCNAGALMIPLVQAVLGDEWVVYTATFLCVQNFYLWTHGVSLISRTPQTDLKKLVKNPNLVAIALGAVLFILHCPLPDILRDTMDSAGNMAGPLCMLSTGMIMADVDLKKIFFNIRIYFIIFLKMIALPLVCLAVMKYTPLSTVTDNAEQIMMILTMLMAAPSANLITQWGALYDNEPDYAGSIGVATTLVCILTMPLIVHIYQM